MMTDKDIEEYHNIEKQMRKVKKNNKYKYLEGKRIE